MSWLTLISIWVVAIVLVLVPVVGKEVVSDVSGRQSSAPRVQVSNAVLQAFSDAWNAHDLDALMSFMSDDCEFHAVAGPDLFGKSWIGPKEVRTGFEQAFINFPDAQWIHPVHFVMPVSTDPNEFPFGVTESTFVGTRTTPDGQRLRTEARMVDVFTFNDEGKIRVKNAFRKDRPPQVVSL